MNINFQYFAIKYIACISGYTGEEAQLIASTCQFISDNYQEASIYTDYDNLSKAIKDNQLYTGHGKNCKVSLLLTALKSLDDLEALSDKTKQEERLIPFDYFPEEQIDENPNYAVKEIKSQDSNAIFEGFFKDAKNLYYSQDESPSGSEVPSNNQRNALVRLGILMHIAVNTFIHTPFNGYSSDKNALNLQEAINSVTYKKITDSYHPEKYKDYPYVGSVRLGGVDSDYNVQYFAENEIDSRKKVIRVNNPIFMEAGKAVYKFLMTFKNQKPTEQEWENTVKPILESGLNTDKKTLDGLIKWWNKETPFDYSYNPGNYMANLVKLPEGVNPDEQGYYDFLVTVDQIRKSVIYHGGEMMKTNDASKTKVICEMEKPSFNGTELSVDANIKTSSKLVRISAVVTVIDKSTGIEILTKPYVFTNTSRFSIEFELNIPMEDSTYDVHYDFSWKEDGRYQETSHSELLEIKGNNSIIESKNLINPSSEDGDKVKVINGTDSAMGDYKYPLNDNYTDQDGSERLDLYLPVEFEMKLADSFTIFRVNNYSISLNGLDTPILYCNNEKYIEENISKEDGILSLKYTPEWKNHIETKAFTNHKASLTFELDIELEVISSNEEGYRTITLKNKEDNPITKDVEFLWGFQ